MPTASADFQAVRVSAAASATTATAVFLLDAAIDDVVVAALERHGYRVAADASEAEAIVVALERSSALAALDILELDDATAPLVALVDDDAAADAPLVRKLVARGVRAVVPWSEVASALAVSIDVVRAGQISFPASAAGSTRPVFTVREKQVLGMVVLGFSNSEIAQRLFVAESTVKSHLSSAFAKLGVRSRRAAADAILDPVNGLGTGILAISGSDDAEPVGA